MGPPFPHAPWTSYVRCSRSILYEAGNKRREGEEREGIISEWHARNKEPGREREAKMAIALLTNRTPSLSPSVVVASEKMKPIMVPFFLPF